MAILTMIVCYASIGLADLFVYQLRLGVSIGVVKKIHCFDSIN